ncbi:MAG: LacI family transcriptional regulator, partial [Actinomycetota bacterium]|nr:LacI family transcriptional regulator [Actinomycetota bacterium]
MANGQPPRGPTIYDVARAAGVAPSTVSRAFSRPGRVNAETAERIRAVAEELGYRANPLARALPTGRTSLLALVVSDVTNPFFFDIIRGAEEAATQAGYTLLVADAHESATNEREALERMIALVEGVVLATSRMSDSAIRVLAKQRPTVVANRALTDVASVLTDNARGMRRAVEHLAELGHHTITYLAGPEASWADGMRWRSLHDGAFELELRSRRLGPFPPTVRGGRLAALEFAAQPSSAVVCYNDLVAIGFMRGLADLGARVPAEVSVIGFDNIFGSDFCSPALTTVAAPLRALGDQSVKRLLSQLRSSTPTESRPVMLPAQLLVRDSTARPGRRRKPWARAAALGAG